ncbi:MAG: hypothetical protein KBB51_01680 [Candidatus Moranbacteria bacterium]|jgi:membrane protein DedA with SNARE-associated domain|nr:hypothetical protein [Candidatus Moranbacteria bacterium]
METLLTQLINDVQPEYWYAFVFFGTFLLGENVIIAAFIFAATQPNIFLGTITFVLLATLATDIFWYLMAVHVISKTSIKTFFERKCTAANGEPLPWHIIYRYPASLLFIIKFLVGIRILLSVSIVLKTRISFRKFLLFDALGAVFFIAILGSVSWLIGTGINPSAHHILTTIIFTVVIVSLLLHWLSRTLLKHQRITEKSR